MKDYAQMNVLEAVLFVIMLLTAVYFVKSMDVSSHTTVDEENQFEKMSKGILRSLGEEPDLSGEYSSKLAYYINYLENVDENDARFYNYVNSVFPSGTMFRILKVNCSKMMHNATATLDDCTERLYGYSFWSDDNARASRIVVVNGFVYEIIISVWFTLRR